MIHQYQNNGYHIVLDVNSGSVHVVDKIAYDVIGCLEAMNCPYAGNVKRREDGRISARKAWRYLCRRRFERSSGGSGRADSGRSVVYTGCL